MRSKSVSIHQPAYLPWRGYFERIASADVHVVLDNVQFEKNSFINRNRIFAVPVAQWLTVPVKTGGRFGNLSLRGLEIENATDWRHKHWESLRHAYGRAPFFQEHAAFFREIYATKWTHLLPLCMEITAYMMRAFAIGTPLVFASQLNPAGSKSQLLADLCVRLGAQRYHSGPLGRNYLDLDLFERAGIAVEFQESPGAQTENLSAVDALFRLGPRARESIVTGAAR